MANIYFFTKLLAARSRASRPAYTSKELRRSCSCKHCDSLSESSTSCQCTHCSGNRSQKKSDLNANFNCGCSPRMMSPKRWILLLIFYISYLMFGASIYYHIQHELETEQRAENLKERIDINDYLLQQLSDKNATTQNEILNRISDYCGKSVEDYTEEEMAEVPYTWTFYHSFFFAFTVCSTVGYGNISPTTTLGRMILIFYAIIGIPVNGILFAGLGEYFAKTFEAIYRWYKKWKSSRNIYYVPPQLGLITTITIALVPGIAIFILLPAWAFSYVEGWPYSLALYYSFVTTTTIGFGDYVATFNPDSPSKFGGWFVVYEIFVIVWFIFSLGYLVMIFTFITRGLQSKKLSRLEQHLSSNIKSTQNRIWNGFTKDVGNIRRLLNELYLIKFKPVYTEEDSKIPLRRSISCPELTMYRVDPEPMPGRKRAFSECYDVIEGRAEATPMVHAASDTDVSKFDKQKSFESAEAFRQTTDLLAKVVTALASIKPPSEETPSAGSPDIYGGYHGFTDSQILASEWSFASTNEPLPPKPRDRACSDFNLKPKWQMRRPTVQFNEWTWSGDNSQIQQEMNNRHRERDRANSYRLSVGQSPGQDYIVNMDSDEPRKPQPRTKKFSLPDGLRKFIPFRKRSSQDLPEEIGTANGMARKFSIVSVPETQTNRMPPLDYYSTVTASATPAYLRSNGSLVPSTTQATSASISPSNLSLASRPTAINEDYEEASSPYPRKITAGGVAAGVAGGIRKRRESTFAPNPALMNRRSSMFPSTTAAGLSQRRNSLFNLERRGSTSSTTGQAAQKRNLPAHVLGERERRPSMFSVTSDKDLEVLEQTTLADLLRALEAMHTKAAIDEVAENFERTRRRSEMGGIFDRGDFKKRKTGNTAVRPQELPPLLSLLGVDAQALNPNTASRLYNRRSTIVGTMNSSSSPLSTITSASSPPAIASTTRRRPSAVTIVEPPPSYSEHDLSMRSPTSPTKTSMVANAASKFRRRFSVRPTALQIPPGKAPPPGQSLAPHMSPPSSTSLGASAPQLASVAATPQGILQKRSSLRPSPLARELSVIPSQSSSESSSPISPSGPVSPNSTTRLLPARPPNPTSSTYSPLSRIVQISQAQRKSSMTEGAKKPDSTK